MSAEYLNIIKIKLHAKIVDHIATDLTIRREANGLVPYTNSEINQFLLGNSDNIDYTVNAIIKIYQYNDKLDELDILNADIINNFLYCFVKCHPDIHYVYNEFNPNIHMED